MKVGKMYMFDFQEFVGVPILSASFDFDIQNRPEVLKHNIISSADLLAKKSALYLRVSNHFYPKHLFPKTSFVFPHSELTSTQPI